MSIRTENPKYKVTAGFGSTAVVELDWDFQTAEEAVVFAKWFDLAREADIRCDAHAVLYVWDCADSDGDPIFERSVDWDWRTDEYIEK